MYPNVYGVAPFICAIYKPHCYGFCHGPIARLEIPPVAVYIHFCLAGRLDRDSVPWSGGATIQYYLFRCIWRLPHQDHGGGELAVIPDGKQIPTPPSPFGLGALSDLISLLIRARYARGSANWVNAVAFLPDGNLTVVFSGCRLEFY
jgi:hypothetical protein